MADPFQARTLKRKNVKGLALNAAPPSRSPAPSEGDAQVPGAIGNADSNRTDTLEIGLEFKLDLKSEDLIVLKELGAGNGGTVSKVMHATTRVVMARKVCEISRSKTCTLTKLGVADYSSRCERKRPETDRERIAGRPRLRISICHNILRSVSE